MTFLPNPDGQAHERLAVAGADSDSLFTYDETISKHTVRSIKQILIQVEYFGTLLQHKECLGLNSS